MPVISVRFKLKLLRGAMVGGLALALLLMSTTQGEFNAIYFGWSLVLLAGSVAETVDGFRERSGISLHPRSQAAIVLALVLLCVVAMPFSDLARCVRATLTGHARLVLTLALSLVVVTILLEAVFVSDERRATSQPLRDDRLSEL